VPEAVAAAELLATEGIAATVLDLTSADRLYREWRGSLQHAGRTASVASIAQSELHLARLIPTHERRFPIVTIHDAASHSLAWLGSVFGTRVVPVGVDGFGQSGTIAELYRVFDLLPEQLVNAALVGLS
jgi:pyruvate dehydrogenase E1 component